MVRAGGQDAPRNDQDRKLFIGGLNPKTDENALRSYYGQWGEIVDAVVMKDPRSGRSRGFGFITYKDSNMVDLAQANRPHDLDGKTVDSKRAMPREDSTPETHTAVKKIFVGGLKKEINSDELSNYFSQFGTVTDCQVVTSKDTGESRGFGFVTFDDTDSVDKVILNRPHAINHSKADVKKALSKEEMRGLKPKPMRGGAGGWNNGAMGGGGMGGYGQQQSWDNMGGGQGYNCGFGGQSYTDYNNASGYGQGTTGGGFGGGYDQSGNGWTQGGGGGMGDGGFGNYNQQSYGGGPMRGGNQYGGQRTGPYTGGHGN